MDKTINDKATTALLPEQDEGEVIELRPTREQLNLRLDRFVAAALPELSRAYVQQLIEAGDILVDGQVRRPAFKMTPGEVVTVAIPPAIDFHIQPEAIPLAVIYEDDDLLVVDKPAGMVVHPAPGHSHGTLVNAVLGHVPNLSVGGSRRPGIVHRLDRDTSGVIVVAKTDRAYTSLVHQWQERRVEKRYLALVAGDVEESEATIDAPVGRDPKQRLRMAVVRTGRDAVTHFRVLARVRGASLLDVEIETGRTHQIRVHLAFIEHPVVGDGVYGNRGSDMLAGQLGLTRTFLHAHTLGFALPDGKFRRFTAPVPSDLFGVLEQLEIAPEVVGGVQ